MHQCQRVFYADKCPFIWKQLHPVDFLVRQHTCFKCIYFSDVLDSACDIICKCDS